ncbi:hypothetical protein [Streptomyces sp. NPDC059092]|uniref:hypothetical protein n=1 Tax=Streptomyces sp. NPDC059092 TaxID=3346725 RepID=UPI0036B08D94
MAAYGSGCGTCRRGLDLPYGALAPLAQGRCASGRTASFLARPTGDITHPLTVLQDRGLVRRQTDAFRKNRRMCQVAEPLINFDHAIVRPKIALLDRGMAEAARRSSRPGFFPAVVGPHFEQLCRDWVAHFAAPETLGGLPVDVSYGTVSDPANRASYEVDVVVHGAAGQGQVMGVGHLERLRGIRDLPAGRGTDVSQVRLVCFGGAGFAPELRAAGERGEAVLVDLDRLYGGE